MSIPITFRRRLQRVERERVRFLHRVVVEDRVVLGVGATRHEHRRRERDQLGQARGDAPA